jgi:hypothetical protein
LDWVVAPAATPDDLTETVAQVRATHPHEDTLGAEPPVEAFLDRVLAHQNPDDVEPAPDLVDGASAVEASGVADDAVEGDESHHEPPHRREVKKTRGRASVPSWDEIMFGGGGQD